MNIFAVLLLLFTLDVIESVTPNGEPFGYLAQEWKTEIFGPRKYAHIGDSFIFSCQTNDPDASVSLEYSIVEKGTYEDVLPLFGGRIATTGQNFSVSELQPVDIRHYRCNAVDKSGQEIKLYLGVLFVNQVPRKVVPEIYPNTTHKIETNGNENITCKAHGAAGTKDSYLKWEREDSQGKRTPIDESRTFRTGDATTSVHIDIEKLMFKNFGSADVGTYVCVRKVGNNEPTEKSITIELEPNISPKISFPNNPNGFKSVKIGDQVTLTCDITGSPKPRKYWKKDGKVVQECPNVLSSRCSFVIRQATFQENDGKYECIGENIVKTISKKYTIEVQVPPVLKKPTNTIVANTKEDRELLCELETGNPFPKFTWEQQPHTCVSSLKCNPLENDWKAVSQQFPSKDQPTSESSIIALATTSVFFYRCSISNKAGSDSHVITLYRKEEASPQFYLESDAETINRKEKLSIKCAADLYVYQSITILRNGKSINGKLSQENQTMVFLYEAPEASLDDSGEYVCNGILKRGGLKKKSLSITVKEITAPVIIGFKDTTISQDKTRHYSLSCQATGNPRPAITWKKNDKVIQAVSIPSINRCENLVSGIYYVNDQDNVFVICSVNFQSHAGDYECEASNLLGNTKKNMVLTINAKPKITESPLNKTYFSIGSEERLVCLSVANPPANVSWVHLSENATEYLTTEIGSNTLEFSDVDSFDQGQYQCIAKNVHGQVTRKTTVFIGGTKDRASAEFIENKGTLTGLIVGFVAVLIVIAVLVFLYRRHLKTKYALYLAPNRDFVLDPNRTLFEQSSDLPYTMVWEFPRERVSFKETIGSGAFGQVFLAEADGITGFKPRDPTNYARKKRKAIQKSRRYHSLREKKGEHGVKMDNQTHVAIKTIKDEASESEYKDLASELKILIHLGEHRNIVNLLGACTTNGKLFVILEYCSNGNLLSFLRERREIFQPIWAQPSTDVHTTFTFSDLVNIGCQVSNGMDFLQSKKCVHRDLAARNVLVDADYNMKIADFGLARDIYKDEFYLKQTTGLLPVKWMSPESLFDKVYTASSDVWSFGILLWETFTLGGSPYPGLPTEDLYGYLEGGGRMKRPDICPKEVYSVMMECWEKSPYQRPLFAQINDKLSYILTEKIPEESKYLELKQGNGNYLNTTPADEKKVSNQSLDSADYIEAVNNGSGKVDQEKPDEFGSTDYVEAVGNGNLFSSPKGVTFVPPPNDTSYKNTDPTSSKTPLLPPSEDEYIPMTPSDHYKNPSSFPYGQEAMV